jgi:hypothetical protein
VGAGGVGSSSGAAAPGHAAAAPTHPAAAQALDVLPFPDTPDVPPSANVVFPAVNPAQIAAVQVEGSRSGSHRGALSAQPAGHGTAFSPYRPFAPGERVTVSAEFHSSRSGTATGAAGARRIRFSFGVARFATLGSATRWSDPALRDGGAGSASKKLTRSFVSAPKLHPPVVSIRGKVRDPGQGDFFLDAQNSGHPGPYILEPHGQLVYFFPAHGSVFNVRMQSYDNHPVLTYWQGRVVPPGVGRGEDLIYNQSYQKIHVVRAGSGYQKRGTDLHEFTLGHEGREGVAFVTICVPVQANLTSVGGPQSGTVLDWIIQEIDIKTNRVIWEWHALGHVPINYSYEPYVPGQPYDFFHLNSIQQLSNGHVLISSRHTFAVYSIDKATGRIAWVLGGKHSSFSMGPGASFEWQHDATLHEHGRLSVFDDNSRSVLGQSRGLALHLGLGSHRATLVRSYFHRPHAILASSQGSVQVLANHNVFVGWGSSSHFSEYTAGGTQLYGGSFRGHVQSYRAYRFAGWVGNPTWSPAIAERKAATAGHVNLYVSWNGATRVKRWRVLGSATKTGSFVEVRPSVRWSSFETVIYVRASKGPYFELEAVDAHGGVLAHGTSRVVKAP